MGREHSPAAVREPGANCGAGEGVVGVLEIILDHECRGAVLRGDCNVCESVGE